MKQKRKKIWIGSMKGQFEIIGDIVAPIPLCLQGWEVINQPERTLDPVAFDAKNPGYADFKKLSFAPER
jgi:hypothetical protein